MKKVRTRLLACLTLLGLLVQTLAVSGPATSIAGTLTPDPTSVTIAGSLQSELGCAGDWDPTCATTHLTYDAADDVWQGSWPVPAGSYEYKAALNDGWDENYGLHGVAGGDNIPLNLSAETTVNFYYDHKSHWITDNHNSVIATVPGSFQAALGCPGDWQPDCLRSWLQDLDGDGTYTFETTDIPAGSYEAKVTINESWDENYGQGGVPGGANIPFTVPNNGAQVRFTYNSTTHVLTISAGHGHDNNVEYDGLGHNSQDLIYRQPFGAINPGTPVTLRFRTFANDVTGVTARLYDTSTSQQTLASMQLVANAITCYSADLSDQSCDYWETVVTPTQKTTLYYRFIVTDGTATAYYADDNFKDGGWGTATPNLIDNSYAITVYDPAFQPISWMEDAVIYQIFPDRFRNGKPSNDPHGNEPRYSYPSNPLDQILIKAWNALPEGYCRDYVNPGQPCTETPMGRDYFGGDLKGVDEELAYLRLLGVNTLYFNPIFDSASDHGYDTQNYYAIDPFFGTQQDWDKLERDASRLGIRVILDGVFNHVSSDSKYFDRYHHFSDTGACESVNSPYRSWFYFQDQAGGPCAGPNGPNTMTYSAWFGFDSLPVLNKDVQAVRDLFYAQPGSVSRYWLNQGADGWRLDVMGDGSFPDSYWQGFRTAVKNTKSTAPIIGELWKKDEILPKIHGDMADTTMNYRFRNAILGFFGKVDNKGFPDDGQSDEPPSLFASKLNSLREDYPDATYYTLMNLMDSHDTQRILWSLTPGENNREDKEFNAANVANGKDKLRLASLVQFTIPGAPTIYYGDEIGMTGSDDPDDRRTFPWLGILPHGDLTLGLYYARLAQIRDNNPVLRDGTLKFLLTDDTDRTLAYGMRQGNQAAIITINRDETSSKTLTIPVGGYLPNGVQFRNALGGGSASTSGGNLVVTLPPLGGAIWMARIGQDLTPPNPPYNLAANAGNGQVSLTWHSVPSATGYNVYRSPLSGGGFEMVGTSTTTSFLNTGVTNSTRYYYVVTARDSAGNESRWSNQASAIPSAPIGWAGHLWPPTLTITINALQTQTVYAQVWVDGVTNLPGQGAGVLAQFAYGDTGSNPATWTWMPMAYNTDVGNNDEYKVDFTPEQVGTFDYLARFSTNLGGTWTYAYTDDLQRGVLTVNASSDTTPPAAPTNPHVTGSSASSISLAWDANSEPDLYRYEVWRSTTSGGPYGKIANVPGGTTEYDDTGVTSNGTYYYVITAQDTSFNRSTNSAQVTGTATPQTVSVTFTTTLPANTPAGDTVHIAGSFPAPYPQWDPGALPMTRLDATHAQITLNMLEGTQVEYKYTRGTWDSVEKGPACEEIPNRQLSVEHSANGTQQVGDTVAKWRDIDACP